MTKFLSLTAAAFVYAPLAMVALYTAAQMV